MSSLGRGSHAVSHIFSISSVATFLSRISAHSAAHSCSIAAHSAYDMFHGIST